MRDTEQNSTQNDSAVEITDLQPQKKETHTPAEKRQKLTRTWLYILIGATALLVLSLIFAGVLAIANQKAKQSLFVGSNSTTGSTTLPTSTASTSTIGATTLPTPASTPIPAPAFSNRTVNITVAGDVAYLSTSDSYPTTLNNTVYALRTTNGTLLWHQEIEGSADQAPLVANGVVYVTSYVGLNGPVYVQALRAIDGSLLWRYSNTNYSYLSLSTFDRNVVYVASPNGISALNASNGASLWHYAAKDTGSTWPLEVNGVVYYTSSSDNESGTLYALRASDGSLIWQYKTGSNTNTPVVANGVVYTNSDSSTLVALRASDGHQIWKRTIEANFLQSPQLVNGVLYTTTTKILEPPAAHHTSPLQGAADIGAMLWNTIRNASAVKTVPLKQGISSVYAIRANDGATLWHYTMNKGGNSWVSWSSVVNGVVYVSDTVPNNGPGTGDLFALQSSNGSVLWHDKLKTTPSGALLANGIIYLSSSLDLSGVVYAVRVSDGSMLWDSPLSGAAFNAPALVGNTAYIGANNGMAYALRANNGNLVWHYFTEDAR
jgi:outer membrane protein assembly factor BamB